MAQDFTASQGAALWQARMEDFLYDCAASARAEQADRVREAAQLFARPHADGLGLALRAPDVAAVEAMLACGAIESAVLALVSPEAGCLLSRGGNGVCLASIVLPDGSEEVTAEGSTMALALLAALVSAVLAGRAESRSAGAATRASLAERLN